MIDRSKGVPNQIFVAICDITNSDDMRAKGVDVGDEKKIKLFEYHWKNRKIDVPHPHNTGYFFLFSHVFFGRLAP